MSFPVMPDLSLRLDSIEIRHPETSENTGFRLLPERRIFIKNVVYKQTLITVNYLIHTINTYKKQDFCVTWGNPTPPEGLKTAHT